MDHALGGAIGWLIGTAVGAYPGWVLHRWIWQSLFGDKEN